MHHLLATCVMCKHTSGDIKVIVWYARNWREGDTWCSAAPGAGRIMSQFTALSFPQTLLCTEGWPSCLMVH